MKELFEIFREEKPDLKLDFILCDGNGILHCNACGLSSHFGVEIDTPTIGCAKTIFAVDGINRRMIGDIIKDFRANRRPKGFSTPLIGKSGRVWGHALKNGIRNNNPLIVSVGHRVNIETAVKVVNACSTGRIPEPIDYVDKLSRQLIKEYIKEVKRGKVDEVEVKPGITGSKFENENTEHENETEIQNESENEDEAEKEVESGNEKDSKDGVEEES